MTFLEALQKNADTLAKTADDLRGRIDLLQKNGFSAQTSIELLHRTCQEIGRLNDAIKSQLDSADAFPSPSAKN